GFRAGSAGVVRALPPARSAGFPCGVCCGAGVQCPLFAGIDTLKLKKIALGTLLLLAVAGTAGWFSLDKETRGLLKTLPTNRDLLFWNDGQRDAAFRAMDRI